MSKIVCIVGTRPEVLRLSIILKKLRKHFCTTLIHTGQNYDKQLNDVFFKELDIKQPEYNLGIHTSNFGEQVGSIFTQLEKILIKERPKKVLILRFASNRSIFVQSFRFEGIIMI